jgi:hypothetical protein
MGLGHLPLAPTPALPTGTNSWTASTSTSKTPSNLYNGLDLLASFSLTIMDDPIHPRRRQHRLRARSVPTVGPPPCSHRHKDKANSKANLPAWDLQTKTPTCSSRASRSATATASKSTTPALDSILEDEPDGFVKLIRLDWEPHAHVPQAWEPVERARRGLSRCMMWGG